MSLVNMLWVAISLIFIFYFFFSTEPTLNITKIKAKTIFIKDLGIFTVYPVKDKKYSYLKNRSGKFLSINTSKGEDESTYDDKGDVKFLEDTRNFNFIKRHRKPKSNIMFKQFSDKDFTLKLRILKRKNGQSFIKFFNGTFLCKRDDVLMASKNKNLIHYLG